MTLILFCICTKIQPMSYLIALYTTAWVLFLRSFYGKAFGDASVLVNKQDKPHAFLHF